MSEPLEFPCPHCAQLNRVPRAYAGKTGKCPGCSKALKVPDPDAPEPAEPEALDAEVDDDKECVYCGERIKRVAKKCRHCGEFLDGSAPPKRQRAHSRVGDYEPCPFCQGEEAEKVNFTWWGGILGPSMLTHVRCLDCQQCFNGKTGQPNKKAIAIYVGVGAALGLGLCVLFGVIAAMS